MCKTVWKLQAVQKSHLEFSTGKKKIIGLLSEFGRIAYVTNTEKIRKQMKENTYNSILVGYADNHTRDVYNLNNPETKRVFISKKIKLVK